MSCRFEKPGPLVPNNATLLSRARGGNSRVASGIKTVKISQVFVVRADGPVYRRVVAEQGVGLVRVRQAAHVQKQADIEDLGRFPLRQTHPACQSGANQAGPHRRLRRQAVPQINHDREPRKQIGQPKRDPMTPDSCTHRTRDVWALEEAGQSIAEDAFREPVELVEVCVQNHRGRARSILLDQPAATERKGGAESRSWCRIGRAADRQRGS